MYLALFEHFYHFSALLKLDKNLLSNSAKTNGSVDRSSLFPLDCAPAYSQAPSFGRLGDERKAGKASVGYVYDM